MRGIVAALLLVTCMSNILAAMEEESEQSPRLLLTPRLLRRLKRDRDRQTVRWQDFEKRVQTAPDSPERGFELALYYAVTQDEQRGREAIAWGVAHACERRQLALISDWTRDLPVEKEQSPLKAAICANKGHPLPLAQDVRDSLFTDIVNGSTSQSRFDFWNQRILSHLLAEPAIDPADLYASVEYLMAMRSLTHTDLRESEPRFFSLLPKEFLLSLKPTQVEHPDWMAHIAALALVTLDPNLENSQFLQGWAMEGQQTLREGPGVAYELMWADPYLPGIAYQNMDPWIYDPAGRLFARTSWDAKSCWVSISASGLKSDDCPLDGTDASFGTLKLLRMHSDCLAVPARQKNGSTMLWNLKPYARLTYEHDRQRAHGQADAAGLWAVPNDTSGKVCLEARPER